MGYQSTDYEDLRDATESTQRRILIETTIANERKGVGIAYLLWFFFGSVGGHNYYVGKPTIGILQMLAYVTAIAAFLSGVLPLAVALWGGLALSLIIDLCLIPARINAQTEKLRERLSDRMIWES